MEQTTNLAAPMFKPSSDSDNEDDQIGNLSFTTVVRAKVLASRAKRRRSLFDCEKSDVDFGMSTLSHADFPTPTALRRRATSLVTYEELGFDKQMMFEILEQEMNNKLNGKEYDPARCDLLSKQLVIAVRDRITTMNLKNFKILCVCYISKRASPAMTVESGCAWDEFIATVDKDSFVDCTFQNESISAVGTIYGVSTQRVRQKPATRSSSFPKTRTSSMIDARSKYR